MQDAGQILQFLRPGGIPTAILIFLIAWLLANKHQLCALRPFAKDDLGRRTK